jgi:hypothetical protein
MMARQHQYAVWPERPTHLLLTTIYRCIVLAGTKTQKRPFAMAMESCKDCSEPMSSLADKCRRCGRPTRLGSWDEFLGSSSLLLILYAYFLFR